MLKSEQQVMKIPVQMEQCCLMWLNFITWKKKWRDHKKSLHSHTWFPHILWGGFCCDNERDSTCGRLVESVSQSVSQSGGRQAGAARWYVSYRGGASSRLIAVQSTSHTPTHTHTHTHVHIHTHSNITHPRLWYRGRGRRRRRNENLFTCSAKKLLGKYSVILMVIHHMSIFFFSLCHYRRNNTEHSSVYLWD